MTSIAGRDPPLTPADWAAWAQAVASVANLLLVFWLFIWADRKHRRERQQDFIDRESERKARVAAFWIEELIMRPHHAFVQKFFDDYETRLKNGPKHAENETRDAMVQKASAEIESFKAEYHKLRYRVIQPLQWVHNDFVALEDILSKVEDLVTSELSKLPVVGQPEANSNRKSPSDKLADLRREFFETIHHVQTKVVLLT